MTPEQRIATFQAEIKRLEQRYGVVLVPRLESEITQRGNGGQLLIAQAVIVPALIEGWQEEKEIPVR